MSRRWRIFVNKVMIVAPHPDDETLGCVGTILKHKLRGDELYWLIVTNISVEEEYDKDRVMQRQEEIDTVSKEYGFANVFKLNFPTTKLDIIPKKQIIEDISKVIDEVRPEIVFIPNRNDAHSDHKITFEAVMCSVKTFRCSFIKRILMYETISETEFATPFQNDAFVPNSFSDISNYLDSKIAIMEIYKGEMAAHPFPRSKENIKALATFRGATGGVKYAEAFMTVKEMW